MKGKLSKIIIILTLVCFLISFCACSIYSEVDETSEESGLQVEIRPENFNYSFEINVTNSLDIVPEGVGVLDVIRSSVVEVYATLSEGKSSGSGVVLSVADTNGDNYGDVALMVTCHHVIESANKIVVKSIDGTEYFASLVGSDPSSDIAVLLIETDEETGFKNITPATWYDRSTDLKVGTEVYAIGNPLGTLGGTVTSGIISAINRDVVVSGRKMTLVQTDAATNAGNSGGGLFDKNTGALLGIVNAGYAPSEAQGLNFAIPGSVVIDIVEQLIGNGYIEGRFDFGVEFGIYRASGWNYFEYFVGIDYLEEYCLFVKNGFLVQDIILSIKIGEKDTFRVPTITNDNMSAVIEALYEYLNDKDCKIGDAVIVEIRRYDGRGNYQDYTISFNIEQYVYGK